MMNLETIGLLIRLTRHLVTSAQSSQIRISKKNLLLRYIHVEETTALRYKHFFFFQEGKHSETVIFRWKAKRRNQFCSSVTWQLTTETGMTPLLSHFLVPPNTQT